MLHFFKYSIDLYDSPELHIEDSSTTRPIEFPLASDAEGVHRGIFEGWVPDQWMPSQDSASLPHVAHPQ